MGIILATLTPISDGSASAGREMRLLSLRAMIAHGSHADGLQTSRKGRTMKKTYEKPRLQKREKLTRATAVIILSGPVENGS
ncbi:hypothetical protein [Mesorhizobium caraganae]|uniref:hypothetical protein n=1 Tax=Mesorhizobium caraganae TaxID=483206 RepID=UPI003ECF8F23